MGRLVERGFRRILRLNETRVTLKVLSAGPASGRTFIGTLNRNSEFAVMTDLGKDPRGKGTLELAKAGAPALAAGCELKDVRSGEAWMVVDTDFSCPDYSLKFVVQLKSAMDQ